ncbi:hypothetical protein Forpe1208_v005465 [Fusarium oxysporum f. sp. rapae]|uniref:Uncharacterized protein n=1 Tax=Fusarium oxysporum f. sp. rapae TaxID=485398 RepID=A0A8J5P717_FUSOX|nr:hypothetical protein Forpe1208_v005465 [Fusarium oxysporum f. sp. rapae]
MKPHAKSGGNSRSFAIVFIINAPGVVKGTLSTHLTQKYNLVHHSDTVPLAPGDDGKISLDIKADLVLSFQITKQNARARYLSRGRDTNDSADKFEKRFKEYELENVPVEEEYRKRGILVSIDVNGTKDENIEAPTKALKQSETWQEAIKTYMMTDAFSLFVETCL